MSVDLCSTLRTVLVVVASGYFGFGLAAENFGNRTPSEDEIVDALDPPKTRKLKVGAAARANEPPSISMQINFAVNSVKISDDSAEKLTILARALQSERLMEKTVKVIGHTDATGSEEYNLDLSIRRAASVQEYLVSLGLNAARLESVGKGESDLLDKKNPYSAENRRVQFAISK